MYNVSCKSILTLYNVSCKSIHTLCSDEGLTLEMSANKFFTAFNIS